MKYLFLLLISPFFCKGQEVIKDKFRSNVKLEEIISGHLQELNGKYKIRITETTCDPGGYIGENHDIGPGIRFVKSGAVTYIKNDTTRIFREGTYFYESGEIVHSAYNRGDRPLVIVNFEIIPADWKEGSPVPKSN